MCVCVGDVIERMITLCGRSFISFVIVLTSEAANENERLRLVETKMRNRRKNERLRLVETMMRNRRKNFYLLHACV